MSVKKLRWMLLSIFILLFLAGCDCDDAEVMAFGVFADDPINGAVVSANPTFTWHESESCTPDRFKIWVDNYFYGGQSGHSEFADGSDTSHTLVNSLEAGKKYTWWMYAVAEDQTINGPPTVGKDFYVGPMCSGQPLLAPVLLSPHENAMITNIPTITFTWEYEGGCLPSSYLYQFATDIGFTDIVDTGVVTDHQMEVTKTFPDCSTLWWRVGASDGNSTGAWSSPSAFHLANSSSCPQIADDSINTAFIYMNLYADDCPSTGFAPSPGDPLNPGCVVSSSGLILHGDGENWGEPPLHEYTAQLGAGPCPSTGLDAGTNRFLVQTPGVYCVSITKAQSVMDSGMNPVNLQHGMWTEPFTYSTSTEVTVEMGPGPINASIAFGWDELDALFPMPYLESAVNCRYRPDPECPIFDIPMMGAQIPIFARDAKSEWKLTERFGVPCYVFLENEVILKAMEDVYGPGWELDQLPIFPDPGPCPILEIEKEKPKQTGCAAYQDAESCKIGGCYWFCGGSSCFCAGD